MNDSTLVLEDGIKAVAASLKFIGQEATDIGKYYFDSGSDALVSALSTNGTAATVASALTKQEVTNGITLVQQINNFLGNASVTQGDYQSSADNLINGSNPATAALSQDVENIGNRLKILGANLKSTRKQAQDLVTLYSSSQLSAVIATFSAYTVLFGCSTTQSKMLSGIVLLQQFIKMLNNEVVTTGDYQTTVSTWTV